MQRGIFYTNGKTVMVVTRIYPDGSAEYFTVSGPVPKNGSKNNWKLVEELTIRQSQ